MQKYWFIAAAAVASVALPAIAEAAPAVATANVNMRSGPSTRYPAVFVVPAGSRVVIEGCLSSANWCDVSVAGYRGWISGSYLQTTYSQRRVYVEPEYYRPLGIPTVTFSLGRYWDDHYRGRPFYRERDRWSRGPDRPDAPPPGAPRPGANDRPDRRPPVVGRDPDNGPRPGAPRPDANDRPDRRPAQDARRPDNRPRPDAPRADGNPRQAERRDNDRNNAARPADDRDRHPLRRIIDQRRCEQDPQACR